MTRHAVLLALALCAMAGAAGTTLYDATLPPELQGAAGNPKYFPPPPTDDSMFLKIDSIPTTGVASGYQGIFIYGDTVYCSYQTSQVDVRDRLTGTLISQFTTNTGTVLAICRVADSIYVSKMTSPERVEVYTLSGTYVRYFQPSGGQQVRGLDWDGTKFWASSYVSPNLTIYTMDRAGTVLKTLTRTGGNPVSITWGRDITLDRMYPNRFWTMPSTATPHKALYCGFDTVANTWSVLDTFQTGLASYLSGIDFYHDPVIGGLLYCRPFSSPTPGWIWRFKVHNPLAVDVGSWRPLTPFGSVTIGAVVAPACTVYNFGSTTAASYWVKLRIGPSYLDSVQVTGHLAGTPRYLTFANWTASTAGTFTVSCSTALTGDLAPANDIVTRRVTVVAPDAGCSHLLAPPGTVDSGAVIAPACSTRNYGPSAASYWVKMRIEPSYLESAYVTAQPAGSASYITFADWTASQRGMFGVSCSTELAGDGNNANDKATGSITVQVIDAGVTQTLAPTGTVDLGTVITPACSVYNYGTTTPTSYNVRMVIGAGYNNVMPIAGHVPGTWVYVTFPDWTADEVGTFAITNCTELPGDMNPGNDCDYDTVVVEDTAVAPPIVGWHEIGQVPLAPSGKLVKDGGWIAYDASRELYYVAKGYKAGDFYSFEPVSRTWTQLADMPLGTEAKGPYKGSVGVSDGNGVIYATKGNNTPGFWKYTADDSLGTWTQLADVPLGLSNKKVKGGTDLAYIEQDSVAYVYLLKGYKTEFYRYDVAAAAWQTLSDAPAGVKAKYDKGSWLAYDEESSRLYAHKAKYSEMYAYDLDSMAWGAMMPGIPLANGQTGKSKKAKDGSDAVVINGKVYTLKGGNTIDFYTYDFATATWAEKETIPSIGSTAKKKRVKAGGSMATDGVYVVALKGNKTAELWLYGDAAPLAPAPQHSSVMSARTLAGPGLGLGPNPLVGGVATLRYSLPAAGPATVRVVDVTGRTVLAQGLAAGRHGATQLDLRSLSAGVYLVRLESGSQSSSRKLVIE